MKLKSTGLTLFHFCVLDCQLYYFMYSRASEANKFVIFILCPALQREESEGERERNSQKTGVEEEIDMADPEKYYNVCICNAMWNVCISY